MKYELVNTDIKNNYGLNLLLERGISDVNLFLNPTEDCVQDWRDLDNILNGINTLTSVLNRKGRIGLLTDCDCDGYSSASLLYNYLKSIDNNITIEYYIHEGKQHGLEDCIEWFLNKNFDLILIPDAGSNDGEYIKQLNCPVIILDHHILENGSIIPPNLILINNQASQNYKNKDLSGVGVVYQFCRGLDSYYRINSAINFMDLTALGLIGDMMSVTTLENQYLIQKGLSKINNGFLNDLLNKQSYSMKGSLTPFSVAFYIVPLINAMIRFGSHEEKERMFMAFLDNNKMVPCLKRGAKGTFEKIGIESARECTNAKSHQDATKKKVSEELEQRIFKNNLLENQVLFVRLDDDDNFPSELNGLIANQLANKYHKPTIVARLGSDGMIKGSARGLNQSKLSSFKDFLNESNLFDYAVGHDNALGIAIPNHNLYKFHEIANEKLKDYNLGENSYKINFIRQANADDISDIIFDLEKYKKVWGQNNPTPLIVIENIRLSKNDIQIIGKNSDTIKFIKNGICYMKFFAKDFIEEIDGLKDIKLDIVGETNVNEWGSFTTPQIFINDYDLLNGSFLF